MRDIISAAHFTMVRRYLLFASPALNRQAGPGS